MTYHQEVILAMELNRAHIGKLVQLITGSWSMTGTLSRVDQHDNREWEISYPSRQLVPVRGQIYTTLHIGPWVGDVIGNQPVTVETVKGTLEAPETATRAVTALITEEESAEARAQVLKGIQPGQIADLFEVPVDLVDPDVVKGEVCNCSGDPLGGHANGCPLRLGASLPPDPAESAEWGKAPVPDKGPWVVHAAGPDPGYTRCGLRTRLGRHQLAYRLVAETEEDVTCPGCLVSFQPDPDLD